MRIRQLTHRFPLFSAATVVALSVACGGQVVLGTNSVQLAEVAPDAVSTTAATCAAGAAHPNVCCNAGPTGSTCGVYRDDAFHPCDPGWTTYPDPRSCCDLNQSSSCAPPPPTSSPAQAGQCLYGCPPGFYATAPITASSGSCCSVPQSGGPSGCFGWGPGGLSDAGSASSSTTCDYVCPAGWQPLTPSSPDVCCRSLDAGVECFSQATGPARGGSSAPPGSMVGAGGFAPTLAGVNCGGSVDGSNCSCSATFGGTSYSLQCSNTTQRCTCAATDSNGGMGGTGSAGMSVCPAADAGNSTTAITQYWLNVCGFPQ
jgi:hypothetical protein